MKKGFTLVELLGVFSIMSMIVLIAVPTVTNLLKQADQDQYENFKSDVFLAAEAYVSSNNDKYLELKEVGKTSYVTIRTLLYADYLDSTISNPQTGNQLYSSGEYDNVILITLNSNKIFEFEFYTEATTDEKTVINAYDILTSESTVAEVTNVKNQINNLPNSKIKTALLNRINYRS